MISVMEGCMLLKSGRIDVVVVVDQCVVTCTVPAPNAQTISSWESWIRIPYFRMRKWQRRF